jgi:hypothetical protein
VHGRPTVASCFRHSSFVNCSLSEETRLLLLGLRGPRLASRHQLAGRPAPAAAHWSTRLHMESLPWRQTLARRRIASPKTSEAVSNASFEFQTVYLFLKIILYPEVFLWSETSLTSLDFLLFGHRSQKIGWSKEYDTADTAVPHRPVQRTGALAHMPVEVTNSRLCIGAPGGRAHIFWLYGLPGMPAQAVTRG